ncbi:MAG: response regulator [Gammaproteobacteria bacterium]|nr:response regulator [Gammaproteobacteria bacterium]
MTSILLVDDHDLVRAGLKSILESNENFQVVAEKASGEEALEYLQTESILPNVVLMDINMPGIGGLETTKRIHHKFPDIKVIAVTALQDAPFPAQLIKAGASGYVTKGSEAREMFNAINSVLEGNQYLDHEVSGTDDNPFANLSDREMQVMLMVTQGHSNQYISDSLFLSPKTISTYRHRVFEKLNVSNDVELTHLAIRYGVIGQ